jgi:uncharacterized protein YndB with AHSA1/START domain
LKTSCPILKLLLHYSKEYLMAYTDATPNTFVIERHYRQPVERVFAAFSDPALKRRWFAEGESHEIVEFTSEFQVGGSENVVYRFNESTPFNGVLLSNHGSYQDIVPGARIVTTSRMSFGDKCISASLVTIELVAEEGGTKLRCTNQSVFFEGADGPELRHQGWLTLLGKLELQLGQY